MYDDLLAFLATERCFIEAEARPDKMMRFLNEYNNAYGESLTLQSNGLIVLQPDADKWAVELRLYVNNCPDTIRTQYGFGRSCASPDLKGKCETFRSAYNTLYGRY